MAASIVLRFKTRDIVKAIENLCGIRDAEVGGDLDLHGAMELLRNQLIPPAKTASDFEIVGVGFSKNGDEALVRVRPRGITRQEEFLADVKILQDSIRGAAD